MTIRIPLQFVAFFGYTAAMLVLAGLISYLIYDWRDEDGTDANGLTLESLSEELGTLANRLGGLDHDVSSLRNRADGLPNDTSGGDSTACHNVLLETITVVVQAQGGQISGGALEARLTELDADFRANC